MSKDCQVDRALLFEFESKPWCKNQKNININSKGKQTIEMAKGSASSIQIISFGFLDAERQIVLKLS